MTTAMTDAATTTEGNASTGAEGASVDTTAATAAGAQAAASEASTQQQATDGQTATGDQTQGDQGKPAGAPEKYEFAMPQGVQLDAKGVEAFSDVARELNLPQEAAQKVLDKMGPVLANRHAEALTQARTAWADGARNDQEFGGEKFAENLAVARKAIDQFGTPELRVLLDQSGLGNHPELIRAFFRAGKAISEDKFVSSGTATPKGSRDAASVLYPNQTA